MLIILVVKKAKKTTDLCRCWLHPVAGQVNRALAFQLRHVVPVEAYPVR